MTICLPALSSTGIHKLLPCCLLSNVLPLDLVRLISLSPVHTGLRFLYDASIGRETHPLAGCISGHQAPSHICEPSWQALSPCGVGNAYSEEAGAMEVMYKTALVHTGLITDSLLLLTELNAHTIGGC